MQEEYSEYSIQDILKILLSKIWLIIGLAFGFALIAAVLSYFVMTPVYQSETEIIVKQELGQGQVISNTDIQTNLNLITTYSGIIQSPAILDEVKANLQLEDLGEIQVQTNTDSQIVKIAVKSTDPEQSATVANEIASVFQNEVVEIMNVNSVYILSEAEAESIPVEPNPIMNIAIGLVLGLMVGALIAFLLDFFDNTIKNEEDIDDIEEDSLLGVVSTLGVGDKKPSKSRSKKKNNRRNAIRNRKRTLVTMTEPDSTYSEEFRNIRTSIELSAFDVNLRSILVTSPNAAEGKSTTAANIAVAFAQHGKKVLLVDTDLRKPTIHYTFQCENNKGISNVLSHQATIPEVVVNTEEPNLDILTSGPLVPNPAKIIGSKNMERFINEAYEYYDIVIFDTPPLLPVAETRLLMRHMSGVVLVVRNELTEKKAAHKAVEMVDHAKGNLFGIVLNDKVQTDDKYYYYGYKSESQVSHA